jgi:GH25 family lysozyme M1 (1,4-beta-N-acetylmuramidase)
MLDLSNNNATGHNFRVAHGKGGQLRVMLKRCQGTDFVDKTFPTLRTAATRAGMRVGAYDYLEPLQATPLEAAAFLLKLLPDPLIDGKDLRPALDCEDPHVTPNRKVGEWISGVVRELRRELGFKPVIYGSGWWLEACSFKTAPGPLWLAAYGKNDGREYPVGRLPKPWGVIAAHQYTSNGNVLGINGHVDVSHVFRPSLIELPKKRR